MAENTSIEWCDHTFNPWWGCTKVSEGCKHCYAMGIDDRFHGGQHWGARGERRPASEAQWQEPLKWQRQCAQAGTTARVFCASMADVFDDHSSIQPEWRLRLLQTIDATPNLEWLVLTKRPEKIWSGFLRRSNIRIGISAECSKTFLHRSSYLWTKLCDLQVPSFPTFLSYEPAIGSLGLELHGSLAGGHIGWVIAGGESGAGARPANLDWFREARDACDMFSVPFFFKQWGQWAPEPDGQMIRHRSKKNAGCLLDGRQHREFPAPHMKAKEIS